MTKRVFLIVLDSCGVGELPDAAKYGDVGSNTLKACYDSGKLSVPNLEKLGLFHLDEMNYPTHSIPMGAYGRLAERSAGKDTTTGHWEIAGLVSETPMPTYPEGFPTEILTEFSRRTGRGVLCNKPYSGTQVILDYGQEHLSGGDLIVYTSADSVFQIAAHEELVPVETLYEYCQIARDILRGEHGVGRVIARPFVGEYPNFVRTANRRDFSLVPPADTLLDILQKHELDTIAVGKISDIFAGKGVSRKLLTHSNDEGMEITKQLLQEDFHGLCFINLVDFDSKYGHRNDVLGYTEALNRFDEQLGELLPLLREDDVLVVTADHGCDPSTPSTDHSREYIPLLVYGKGIKENTALGTGTSFGNIAATVAELLGVDAPKDFCSYADMIRKEA